jgi:hypothetical protein
MISIALMLTLLVLFAGLLDFLNTHSEQCNNETNAFANDGTIQKMDPLFSTCYPLLMKGTFDCDTDASQFADKFKEACDELGGQPSSGDIVVKCDIALQTNATALTWNVQNYNVCLGPSCTESDVQLFSPQPLIEEVTDMVNAQEGITCAIEVDVQPSSPSTVPPSSDSHSRTTDRLLLLASIGAAAWSIVLA